MLWSAQCKLLWVFAQWSDGSVERDGWTEPRKAPRDGHRQWSAALGDGRAGIARGSNFTRNLPLLVICGSIITGLLVMVTGAEPTGSEWQAHIAV